jgi:hypothetical protein
MEVGVGAAAPGLGGTGAAESSVADMITIPAPTSTPTTNQLTHRGTLAGSLANVSGASIDFESLLGC